MKKLLMIAVAIVMFAGVANAQEYKPFKIGLGLGYANPSGEGAGGGVLFYVEPAYRLNDDIAIGLRWETAAMVRGVQGSEQSVSGDIAGVGSFALSGQYYLSSNTFRPLVGLGVGVYSLASVGMSSDANGGDAAIAAGSKVGFFPRIGFDAGHFNMALEYNFIPSTTGMTASGNEVTVKNSYLGFKIGASILGGRR